MNLTRSFGWKGGIFVFLLQSSAYAADEFAPLDVAPKAEASSSDAHAQDEDMIFKELPSVYSASKYEQKVSKAPASISIVTADEIKKWGYRNFGEILASLKGFYRTNDRNYGYVGVRGFGLPSDYNTRLLLLIDGHRINENIYDSFDIEQFFPLDIDNIERVEVVRGPSSSLYGSNAFFGVINVISKRGRDQHGVSVKSSYGSFDAYKTSVSYGDRYKNGAEAYVTGTYYDAQGHNSLYYPEFDTAATNHGVSERNDGEQAKKLMTKLSFEDFTLQGLYVNRRKNVPTASFGTVFNSPYQNSIDETAYLDLKYDHTFDNQLNVLSRVSYNIYDLSADYPYPSLIFNKDHSRGQWWRAELQGSKVVFDDHHVTAGGEFQGNFDQFQTNYDQSPKPSLNTSYFVSHASTYKFALFLQDEYSINNYLTFNAGVRWDHFSNFGSTVNPRLALIYKPWEQTALKFLYGTAFRSPNQYEFNYSGSFLKPNPGLRPETLETTEIILEHYFNEQWRGEVNAFNTDITNIIENSLIYRDPATGNGYYQNKNRGGVNSKGVELQIENNTTSGYQTRLSYSWQDTVNNRTNQRLSNSPEHLVKLNVIAPLWNDKVFLGFETQYVSGRRTTQGSTVKEYVVSNVTLFTQKWIKGVELSTGVYNLFNQHYFDPGSLRHAQAAIEQDGITFRIKASVDF